jgi:hypothetical protein
MDSVLVGALAAVAIVALGVALGALYLLARFSIAQGRFDTDAMQKAVNLQRYINGTVENRISNANLRVVRTANGAGGIDAQPPDPNVRQTGRVDDVHEAEREAARMMGNDAEMPRDYMDEQPESVEV